MDDEIDELIVAVRADTQGFAADMRAMRSEFDTTVLGGFDLSFNEPARTVIYALRQRGALPI